MPPHRKENSMSKMGVITVQDFEKAVEVFGFNSPVVTAIWNAMANNPDNADEFETVFALTANGRYMKEYRYGMRLRGFSIGCQPVQGLDHAEDDPTGRYYNILVYNRPLTEQEIKDYELDEVKGEQA